MFRGCGIMRLVPWQWTAMNPSVMKLKNFSYNDHVFDELWVILDKFSSPPILPLLYTTHLSNFGEVFDIDEMGVLSTGERARKFKEKAVSSSTIRSYVYCLSKFLRYLDFCQEEYKTPGMHSSSSCSTKFINYYLNEIIPERLESEQSLNVNHAALKSYFNWLSYLGYSGFKDIRIYRKTRQKVAEKSTRQHYIQYLTKSSRVDLLSACETLADKLVVKMGFEVGLRSGELQGIRMTGKNGLDFLFTQLKDPNFKHVDFFQYQLNARHTKGKKSRFIYFSRDLLEDMRRYFETERKQLVSNKGTPEDSFFVRRDHRFKGTGITKQHASNVFRRISKKIALKKEFCFHDLRHTFATELYYSMLLDNEGNETRSESAALLEVALRLGHALGLDGRPASVTAKYIRLFVQMKELEALNHKTTSAF